MKILIEDELMFENKDIEIIENDINILIGKNNVGKSRLLNYINNFKDKTFDKKYYLDLNMNPFDDFVKQPSDINKNKSNSYIQISELFKIDNKEFKDEINNLIKSNINFESIKNKFASIVDADDGIDIEIDEKIYELITKKPLKFIGTYLDKEGIIESHDITGMGLGIIRITMLKILSSVIDDEEKNTLLLIDEPEAFLHPSLLKEMVDILNDLVQGGCTVVLTTHSANLLYLLRKKILNFNILSKPKKGLRTSIKTLDRNVLQSEYNNLLKIWNDNTTSFSSDDALNNIISIFSPEYCQLFFADKIVAVEGPSDVFFFKSDLIIDKLIHFYKVKNIEIVPFYGLFNIIKIVTLLKLFNMDYILIVDNDGDHKEQTKRVKRLRDNAVDELFLLDDVLEKFLGIPSVDHSNKKVFNLLQNYNCIDIDNVWNKLYSIISKK